MACVLLWQYRFSCLSYSLGSLGRLQDFLSQEKCVVRKNVDFFPYVELACGALEAEFSRACLVGILA